MKYFSILAIAILLASCASEVQQQTCDVRISWDKSSFVEMSEVNVANAGYVEHTLYYPRVRQLSDGSLLMSFMNHKFGWDIYVRKSYDGGKTWTDATLIRQSHPGVSPLGKDIMSFVNPDFIQLRSGRIIMAYQWRYLDAYHDFSVTNENCGLELVYSDDCGLTWSEPREIYRGRCWEPAFLELPTGEIQMYLTDSSTIEGDHTLTCTGIFRSFDGGMTWQGKELCRPSDIEPISSTVIRGRRLDGMASAVQLENGGIICPLEVFSHIRIQDQTPVVVQTTAEANWVGDNQKIRLEGGPEYPWKKELYRDFYGFSPYCCILPTGEPIVASNGRMNGDDYRFWVFVGSKDSFTYEYPTSPLIKGYWGMVSYIGNNKVLAGISQEYKKNPAISDNRTTISPDSRGWKNPADNIGCKINLKRGYLNYSKILTKGDEPMVPVSEFDRDTTDYWFLGRNTGSSLFQDFGYTKEHFILKSYIFDKKITAYMAPNSDASALLLHREGKGTWKIVVNAVGRWQVYELDRNSWHLTAEGTEADEIEVAGTVNNNTDEDYGFKVKLNIPWNLIGGRPGRGEVMKALQRHHYKDHNKEKPAWKYEDAEGMNVNYPSEWLSITLK